MIYTKYVCFGICLYALVKCSNTCEADMFEHVLKLINIFKKKIVLPMSSIMCCKYSLYRHYTFLNIFKQYLEESILK